ncbi:MAG: phosphodiesterase [Clostridia bacterium]|nr:phosphodiesterase [Clostridia bacterium]
MKLLIASDIHGDIESAEILINVFNKEKCDKIVLLGDILYHGPRNDLPGRYAPKEVISLLNKYKDRILAVRGNCDTEVDQMVLEFPILADYAILSLDGLTVYATHGHNYNTKTPPPMANGDILLHGHTHVIRAEKFGEENTYINPGSITLPKENCPRSYVIYEDRKFTFYNTDSEIVKTAVF